VWTGVTRDTMPLADLNGSAAKMSCKRRLSEPFSW
jgi:hypothetical protein